MKMRNLILVTLVGFSQITNAQQSPIYKSEYTTNNHDDSVENTFNNYNAKMQAKERNTVQPEATLDKKCDDQYKDAEKIADGLEGSTDNLSTDVEGGISPGVRDCVKLTKGKFRSLYQLGGAQGEVINWNKYLKYSYKCMEQAKKECEPGKTIDQNLEACAEKNINMASSCDAAAYLMAFNHRDWKNPEHRKATPVNGAIVKCTTSGVETLDFEACAKFSQNGDMLEVGQAAVQAGQVLYYKDKTMTEQMNLANSTNSATGALEGLKSGVKAQEDIMTQRAAMDSAKLTTLATYFHDMPDIDSVSAECNKSRPLMEGLTPENQKKGCQSALLVGGQFALLQNGDQKDKMKSRLVAVGVNVASDAVMANMMNQRAGQLDSAIAKINAFQPIDPLAPAPGNLQSTFCQLNPGDPTCLTGGLNRTFDTMGDNVITFGDGGTGTSYANTNPQLNNPNGSTNPTAASDSGRKSVAPVGSAIVTANQPGGLVDKAPAATVTKGPAPTAGGGGGGAGGGGASGGGGGAPSAGSPGGVSAAIGGKAPNYGGGGGSLSMMGGFGINKSKSTAKADGNPFGKLFDKGGNKGGVVDFGRAPASTKVGDKNDNIFEMISKRYTNVSSDKRLIEYEIAK